ncbi:Maf family protein [Alkalilacustris brevis]|uniref:Maf family protein n=1 Tax=Alkalilacustris brevis TaxID=2026338 RepID=UPI000E0DDD21|nr:Maf family protein [Alkalilacustris brevis]
MSARLVLASSSRTRADMLTRAGLEFSARPARIDEENLRAALLEEGANARSLADVLAEQKACKVSARCAGALVIGSDQILEADGRILNKPESREAAQAQLEALRGGTHSLISAVVLARDGRPVWRSMDEAHLTMRDFSDSYLQDYLARNWPGLRDSVGGYKIEEEGPRLFSRIEGSYFTILGLPLLDLLNQLAVMNEIAA